MFDIFLVLGLCLLVCVLIFIFYMKSELKKAHRYSKQNITIFEFESDASTYERQFNQLFGKIRLMSVVLFVLLCVGIAVRYLVD